MRTEVTDDRLHAPVKQGFLPLMETAVLALLSIGSSGHTMECLWK
jgi:hypothetical protein